MIVTNLTLMGNNLTVFYTRVSTVTIFIPITYSLYSLYSGK